MLRASHKTKNWRNPCRMKRWSYGPTPTCKPILSEMLGKRGWQAILLLLCGLLAFSTSQSVAEAALPMPVNPTHPFYTGFTPSVSYDQALRLITDLGLQPAFDCAIWQPMGQKEAFAQDHRLLVAPAYLTAPDDWLVRLQHTAGVEKVVEGYLTIAGINPPAFIPADTVYTCPSEGSAPLNAGEAGDYLHIRFASSQTTYDQALSDVVNSGLELVDPCYRQSREQGLSWPWHPMGQEGMFAQHHALIVQTDKQITSSQWRAQLRALPDVTAVEPLAPPLWCWTPKQTALVAFGALGAVAVGVAAFWGIKRRRARRLAQ